MFVLINKDESHTFIGKSGFQNMQDIIAYTKFNNMQATMNTYVVLCMHAQ